MLSDAIDIAAELTRLEVLTNFELRREWRRLHGMQPPKSLSRDLLLRGIREGLRQTRRVSITMGRIQRQLVILNKLLQ